MKRLMGIIISVVSFLVGDIDLLLKVLICIMITDYITGIWSAIYNNRLSSKTGFKGILKKLCILSIICLSNLAGTVVGVAELRTVAISFYISNEAVSILENAAELGVPLPKKLKEMLKQLNDKLVGK